MSIAGTLADCYALVKQPDKQDSVLRFFEESDDFLARHRGETLEKIIDRFTSLKVIEQGLDGNPGPMEDGEAAHYVRAA